jgi:hydroxylysine kinase
VAKAPPAQYCFENAATFPQVERRKFVPPIATDRIASTAPDAASVFLTAAQATPSEEAGSLVRDHFGISGSLSTLASERDQNFHIHARDGEEYILKIANPAEDPAVTDLQTQILLHLSTTVPLLPIQRMVRARNGAYQTRARLADGTTRTIRLVTRLPGTPLHKLPPSRLQRENLGSALATLNLALSGFNHSAARRRLLWNLSEAMNVRDRVAFVSDSETRELAMQSLENFERVAAPVLDILPQQIIHCDFNPHNVLVDTSNHKSISGILDFGDALSAPRVNDVAIAASYHLTSEHDPLNNAAEVVRGYHSHSPIDKPELEILPVLMGARLAMTVEITSWRAEIYPQNRDYILRNAPSARAGLRALARLSLAQSRDILIMACSEV